MMYRCDISFCCMRYRGSDFSLERYHDDLSLIYRFDAHRFERYLPDLSAINHRNKARYSAIITCMTFAQYCIYNRFFFTRFGVKKFSKFTMCSFCFGKLRSTVLKTEEELRKCYLLKYVFV